MKKLLLPLALIGFFVFVGFKYSNPKDINLSISENEDSINMSAKFPNDKTTLVQNYLTEQYGEPNELSFKNTDLHGDVSLKDGTNFYMKLSDGQLKIEMDRAKNSRESESKLKKTFEGLKRILTSK